MKTATTLLHITLIGAILFLARRELTQSAGTDAAVLADFGLAGRPALLPVGDRGQLRSGVIEKLPADVTEMLIEDVLQTGEGGLKVVLKAIDEDLVSGRRYLGIYVGTSEALAIARELYQARSPRPMTHDLLRNAIALLGGTVEQVTVTHLANNTFFAAVTIRVASELIHLDARPSDSLALALRTGAKIFVANDVLRAAGLRSPRDPRVSVKRDYL